VSEGHLIAALTRGDDDRATVRPFTIGAGQAVPKMPHFDDVMLLLAEKRAESIRNGYRLPVLNINLYDFKCSENIDEYLYSVGVILR